jgi:hypothetical protein
VHLSFYVRKRITRYRLLILGGIETNPGPGLPIDDELSLMTPLKCQVYTKRFQLLSHLFILIYTTTPPPFFSGPLSLLNGFGNLAVQWNRLSCRPSTMSQ